MHNAAEAEIWFHFTCCWVYDSESPLESKAVLQGLHYALVNSNRSLMIFIGNFGKYFLCTSDIFKLCNYWISFSLCKYHPKKPRIIQIPAMTDAQEYSGTNWRGQTRQCVRHILCSSSLVQLDSVLQSGKDLLVAVIHLLPPIFHFTFWAMYINLFSCFSFYFWYMDFFPCPQ